MPELLRRPPGRLPRRPNPGRTDGDNSPNTIRAAGDPGRAPHPSWRQRQDRLQASARRDFFLVSSVGSFQTALVEAANSRTFFSGARKTGPLEGFSRPAQFPETAHANPCRRPRADSSNPIVCPGVVNRFKAEAAGRNSWRKRSALLRPLSPLRLIHASRPVESETRPGLATRQCRQRRPGRRTPIESGAPRPVDLRSAFLLHDLSRQQCGDWRGGARRVRADRPPRAISPVDRGPS